MLKKIIKEWKQVFVIYAIGIVLYLLYMVIYGLLHMDDSDAYHKYMNPSKDVVIFENMPITADRAIRLMSYYFRKPNIEEGDSEINNKKASFWNQACLFYNDKYCIKYSKFISLRESDDDIRQIRYKNNKIDYSFLDSDKSITNDERQCYLIYYKTQDNMELNKKEFVDSYPHCKDYYYKHLPELKIHEQQFLDIFK